MNEDLAYVAFQDAERVAWERAHPDALVDEAYATWKAMRSDDDEQDLSRDAFERWCEDSVVD